MKSKINFLLIFFSFLILFSATSFKSSSQQTTLIELYTSEGCHSCPPADEWLSRVGNGKSLWSEFVPVAFHVDYWDAIGWKDVFAQSRFSDRQRRYASNWNSRSVYTPGFVLNGKEWRGFFSGDSLPKRMDREVGVLQIQIQEDNQYRFQFTPTKLNQKNYVAHMALLGSGFKIQVERGENRGKLLEHDFVVVDFKEESLKLNDSDDLIHTFILTPNTELKPARYAVVAWVTESNGFEPIQAAGGYLEGLV